MKTLIRVNNTKIVTSELTLDELKSLILQAVAKEAKVNLTNATQTVDFTGLGQHLTAKVELVIDMTKEVSAPNPAP